MTDTATNEVAPKEVALETTAPGDQPPIDAPQPEPAANSNAGVTADAPPPEAPLKATKAKALTASDRAQIAREKAAAGKFPPLETVLAALRYKDLTDGELPDEQSGNFEAPDYYDWADLLAYVQHATGRTAKDLMENTLAGFPSASAINHAEKQFAGKYKRFPIMEDGAIFAPGGLRWIVLQAVEKQVMSGIKAPPRSAEEGAIFDDIRRYNAASSVIMMDQKMGADVKKAIQTHRKTMDMTATAQRNLDAHRAAKIIEDETYRRMALDPAALAKFLERERRSGAKPVPNPVTSTEKPAVAARPPESLAKSKLPKETPIKIETPRDTAKEFDIETAANVLRIFVRDNKRPPIGSDNKTRITFAPGKEIAIERLDKCFDKERVEGGESIFSLADFKERMGFINQAQYASYALPENTLLTAQDLYNDLKNFAADGKNLNILNGTANRNVNIGGYKAGQIAVALQTGIVSGWEELAKTLGLPENTPAPVCLYDFMVETKLATRNHNYELVNSVPAPKPGARIREIVVIAATKQKQPEPEQKPRPPTSPTSTSVADIAQVAARLEERQKAKKLTVKSAPKPVAIPIPRPPKAAKYEIAPIITGMTALTRANKKPPTSMDNHRIIIGDKEVRIDAVDEAIKAKRVKGAESIKSFSDLKASWGYVNRNQIPRYETPLLKEISAKDAFDMVSGYVAAKKSLPSIETKQGRGEKIGEYEGRDVNVIQLSLAFQDGVVTGWDKITEDRPDIQMEGKVPVPTCLYEFLTASNFARRKDDLTLEIFPIHAEADLDALLDEVLGENHADDDPSEEAPAEPAL